MIHLRLTVPDDLLDTVMSELRDWPGIAHLIEIPHVSVTPPGALVLCDVAQSTSNDLIEWLQDHDVHKRGSIVIERLDAVVSDAAQDAEESLDLPNADALIWEEVEAEAREGSELNASFIVFIAVAAVIAVVGIILDSPILIVAAMVVGPEYGPIAAVCVSAARARWSAAGRALVTLTLGFGVATLSAVIASVMFRWLSLAPTGYTLGDRSLTAFIAKPDTLSAIVAALAGTIGMLSFTESRSGALIGVLVSVTTIPAVANIGASAAYGEWSQFKGSAAQLGINVAGLLVFGLITIKVQSWYTSRMQPRTLWSIRSKR